MTQDMTIEQEVKILIVRQLFFLVLSAMLLCGLGALCAYFILSISGVYAAFVGIGVMSFGALFAMAMVWFVALNDMQKLPAIALVSMLARVGFAVLATVVVVKANWLNISQAALGIMLAYLPLLLLETLLQKQLFSVVYSKQTNKLEVTSI